MDVPSIIYLFKADTQKMSIRYDIGRVNVVLVYACRSRLLVGRGGRGRSIWRKYIILSKKYKVLYIII